MLVLKHGGESFVEVPRIAGRRHRADGSTRKQTSIYDMGVRHLFIAPNAGSLLTGVENDVGHRRGTGRALAGPPLDYAPYVGKRLKPPDHIWYGQAAYFRYPPGGGGLRDLARCIWMVMSSF